MSIWKLKNVLQADDLDFIDVPLLAFATANVLFWKHPFSSKLVENKKQYLLLATFLHRRLSKSEGKFATDVDTEKSFDCYSTSP